MKKIYFIILGAAVLMVGVLGARMLSGPEDIWLCQNGQWVKHGAPGAPMPTSGCGQQIIGKVKGAIIKPEVFIDVRTDQEWQAGHIDGALHFDLAKLQQGQMPDLPKDTPIALYCRTGIRAGMALRILQQNGFTNARNAGGYEGLLAQGLPSATSTPVGGGGQ